MRDQLLVPPHDLDAEAAVLSAIMIDGKKIEPVLSIIHHEMFYSESHRRIFEACANLFRESKPIDTVQVATLLRTTNRLAQVGGLPYLTEVLNSAPSLSEDHVIAYAETVLSKYRMRTIISSAQEMSAEGYTEITDVDEYASKVLHKLQLACETGTKQKQIDKLGNVIKQAFTELAERIRNGQSCMVGLSTGYRDLDKFLAGWHPGDLTIIGARPGAGKTAFVLNACIKLAMRTDTRYASAFFSLEMPSHQLANRAACSYGQIDLTHLRNGTMTNDDWRKMASAAQQLYDAPIYIDDQPNLSIAEMRTKLRTIKLDCERKGIKLALAVVDYMQLMRPSVDAKKKNSRIAEIDEVVQELKNMSKMFEISIVALSQLSRTVETRDDKRPRMSDLRESGAIEAAADNIIGLYRDDYYNDFSKDKGLIEAIILKQRNGPTGTIKLKFDAAYTQISDVNEDQI